MEELIGKIKGKPAIVEGIKDKKALESLGFRKIIALNSRPIYKVVEGIKAKEVIILTDLDKEGKKLYKKLLDELSRNGIKVDNTFRDYLFKNTELRQMEGLPKYLNRGNNNKARCLTR